MKKKNEVIMLNVFYSGFLCLLLHNLKRKNQISKIYMLGRNGGGLYFSEELWLGGRHEILFWSILEGLNIFFLNQRKNLKSMNYLNYNIFDSIQIFSYARFISKISLLQVYRAILLRRASKGTLRRFCRILFHEGPWKIR